MTKSSTSTRNDNVIANFGSAILECLVHGHTLIDRRSANRDLILSYPREAREDRINTYRAKDRGGARAIEVGRDGSNVVYERHYVL